MKNNSLYVLEGLACIFVVFIHCNFPSYLGMIINVLARFAVPLFFIVSGYFNFNSSKEKLKQRARKLLKILFISIIVYYIYNIVQNMLLGTSFIEYNKEIFNTENIIKMVFLNDTHIFSGHLWFVLALLYCYIFHIITINSSLKKYYKFIPLLLIIGYIINILTGIVGKGLILSRNWLFLGIPFYLIGHYVKANEEKVIKISNQKLFLIAIIGIFSSMIERVICKIIQSSTLDIYIGITLFVVSIFIFAVKEPNALKFKFLAKLGEKYSLYMYVIHYIFIYVFKEILSPKYGIVVNGYILPILIVILAYITSLIIGNTNYYLLKQKKNKV